MIRESQEKPPIKYLLDSPKKAHQWTTGIPSMRKTVQVVFTNLVDSIIGKKTSVPNAQDLLDKSLR